MSKFSTLARGMRAGQKGFTLIELLIVVAILGILAAVIIPNVSTFMSTGKLNAARTEVENVKTAALAFYADWSLWPGDQDDLTGTDTTINTAGTNYIQGTLKGTYVWDATTGVITGTLTDFNWNAANLTFDK